MSTAVLPPAQPRPPQPLDIEEELKESYLNYAMSVIISRALPDVRDGLKPSQRRILVAMRDLGLTPGGSTSKCAGIVGETMKRYHPHGDNSIYPTLTRMAQWWNMRHLLITGQGNFGSIHGLPPAAMRYTEAKLSPVAAEMLEDLQLDTVDFQPNYDEKYQEPRVLPGKFPNLLVNGSGGIAVGMATSIPPHNLGEVCDALIAYIDNPAIELDELMEIIPGPDFPTGATICNKFGLREAYRTGRGRVLIRAKYDIEEHKDGRAQIIFTEIPYQLTKEVLLKKLAELVNGGRITGVSNIDDYSDRNQPVRIAVTVKKGEDPNVVVNQLFEYSPLQDTFSVIMLALVDGRPKTLPLKDLLRLFVEHRINVIRRRTQYQLRQARQRAHIVEGLLIALAYIDEIIRVIRSSANPPEARTRLMGIAVSAEILRRALDDPEAKESAGLTRMQADAILIMQLQRLTGLEADKLAQEYLGLKADIAGYERILADEGLILDIIRADLREMKEKYANPRRSMISDEEIGDYDKEALIREEYMVVTVTHDGYIKRLPPSTYRAQGRGGRGIAATNTKEGDFLERMFVALTHDYILFFTDKGKVYWLKVYDLPLATRTAGRPGDRQPAATRRRRADHRDDPGPPVPRGRVPAHGHPGGTVKKTELTAFKRPAGARDHRPGTGGERPAHRRGARQGGRPRDPQHPGRHGDPLRRVAGPLDGPAGLRRQGDRPGRGRRGRRHDRGRRRRGPGQHPDRLRQGLRQADPADRVPHPEPRRQGPHRHPDLRPQRAGRRRGQGHRRRRDHARPPAAGLVIRTRVVTIRTDRPQHPGRPADQARRRRYRQQPRQAPPRGARRAGVEAAAVASRRRRRRRRRLDGRHGPTSSTTAWPRPRPATTSTETEEDGDTILGDE